RRPRHRRRPAHRDPVTALVAISLYTCCPATLRGARTPAPPARPPRTERLPAVIRSPDYGGIGQQRWEKKSRDRRLAGGRDRDGHPSAIHWQDRGDGVLEPRVGVGDDQLHPGKAAGAQRPQEGGPERAVLAGADVEAQDLPVPVRG